MVRYSITSSFLLLLALLTFAGCSGRRMPPPKACVPVQGRLLVNARPAAGAMVYFRPEDGSPAETWGTGYPRARVGADGTFVVTTYSAGDGAPPGEYRLLVEWLDGVPPSSADEEGEGEETDYADAEDRLGGRYLDPATTPLRATVNDEATELPVIELR
jgi:hypothetical protein